MPRTRPRVTPSDALLLFVTEPQQLDAVFEFGTETLSPASIRLGDDTASGWACEWCGAPEGRGCADDCDCPSCEGERALDEDADAYFDREV